MAGHDKGDKMSGDAKAAARQVGDAAKESGSELRAKAGSAASAVRDDAMNRAETARVSVAEDIDAISRALRRGREELREDTPQARVLDGLADSVGAAAEALRTQDLPRLTQSLRGYARQHPTTFLLGAALVGFAATRFARASARDHADNGGSGAEAGMPPMRGTDRPTMGGSASPVAGRSATGTEGWQ